MNIVYIFGHIFNVNTWANAVEMLEKDGIHMHIYSQRQNPYEALEFMNNNKVDIFIGHLFHDLPCHTEMIEASQKAAYRIGIGMEMPADFTNLDEKKLTQFESYSGISVKNYYNSICFLASCTGMEIKFEKPDKINTHGIYHPESDFVFEKTQDYLKWYSEKYISNNEKPLAGILCYYGQIMEKNCADIDGVIQGLERNGIIPVCVFAEGMADSALPLEKRYTWLPYFKDASQSENKLKVILNLFGGRFLSKSEDSSILEDLNIPVIQLMRLWNQTVEEWEEDKGGMGSGSAMVFSLAQPEISGVIEPTVVAASTPEKDSTTGLGYRRYQPIEERIDHLCARLQSWFKMQDLPNAEKKLTIVLNNNPCKGVEATLGLASGLDTFESLIFFMHSLRDAGYNITNIPEKGEDILNLFLDKKAISEFRWTTTDEIVSKGGVIHMTDRNEYEGYLSKLPEKARSRILDDWGEFPGEGMVYNKSGEDVLLVTGLKFGNVQIIIQPKRGCYGAKCNGEVCRILHDPEISPPPHWLATYKFIQDTSDAVVHFGTHGALEFLPGKRAALSAACFPEISIGNLPNIYLYTMDVPGDGVVAKRRGKAVMVDHLTPVQKPAVMGEETDELEQLITEYEKSSGSGESKRNKTIIEKMIPLMKQLKFVKEDYDGEDFENTAALVSRQISRCKRSLAPEGMHLLGTAPEKESIATMLTTILIKKEEGRPTLEEIASWAENPSGDTYIDAKDVVKSFFDNDKIEIDLKQYSELKEWCLEVGGRAAMSTREITQLIKALNGEYIEPGLSASLYMGKTQVLPTGRNFFTADVLAMPSKSAWDVGRELADNLLRKYLTEEGKFPESVGLSLWSIDAFHSDGEVFCQLLYLMGMKPEWASTGRISGIKPIELDDLNIGFEGKTVPRPRIDVVIQTSGILRDMVPHFTDYADEAAVTAGELDEPFERNFIRKHTLERLEELKKELSENLSESELKRMASYRVFSSAPGTYGTGVGLAIDASAWETEEDLAETYINWSGYAYGSDNKGKFNRIDGAEMQKVYAKNLKSIDVTYMRQYSAEHDLVDSGCYIGFMGGMAVASKAVSGKKSKLYWTDLNAEGDLSVRDLKDDINAAVRVKLFNENWIKDQKKYGYQGAEEVSSRVNNLFKWSATTQEVEKWVFDSVVEIYIRNEENFKWLKNNNPYAFEEITRRLLEAQSRGLWEADEDFLQDVQDVALMIEGDMEDIMGDVQGEFQGSKVDVMTSIDVEKWNNKWKIDR
ncbi:MAG: cobaltochelatase subunit CobN [Spirochaetes bacterium]|nr:cobaltochelatase subunit CobN [Spirochaetota bacterium]